MTANQHSVDCQHVRSEWRRVFSTQLPQQASPRAWTHSWVRILSSVRKLDSAVKTVQHCRQAALPVGAWDLVISVRGFWLGFWTVTSQLASAWPHGRSLCAGMRCCDSSTDVGYYCRCNSCGRYVRCSEKGSRISFGQGPGRNWADTYAGKAMRKGYSRI